MAPVADEERPIATDTPERDVPGTRPLSNAARRALAEAEERRRTRAAIVQPEPAQEQGGRKGPEPVRYGDWEKNGIISDF